MNLQLEPPEEKKMNNLSLPPSMPLSFSLLPDEIILSCVARIPRSYYPTLSIVSKSFRSLISSKELYAERSHIGSTQQCIYVCYMNFDQIPLWFTLWDNPNRTLSNSSVTKKTQSLVSIPPHNYQGQPDSIEVVGSEIYVIGGVYGAFSSAVRVLNCRTHTWRDGPSMNVARQRNFLSCVYDGKIYVLGGLKRIVDGRRHKELEDEELWAEVFDTKTQTWERLPEPGSEIRKCDIVGIREMEGMIMFGNSRKVYAYDTNKGKWECCENKSVTFSRFECVIENVLYRLNMDDPFMCPSICQWYDIKAEKWIEVKGLDALRNKYRRYGGLPYNYTIIKLVSFGGKLLLSWEVYTKEYYPNGKFCAEITVEKRDGDEVWGNVEWIDVEHTVPSTCELLHCLVVSV